jgi:hypothetical protein
MIKLNINAGAFIISWRNTPRKMLCRKPFPGKPKTKYDEKEIAVITVRVPLTKYQTIITLNTNGSDKVPIPLCQLCQLPTWMQISMQ